MRRERRYGAFSRTIALPDGVDPKKIKATTADGILEIAGPAAQGGGGGAGHHHPDRGRLAIVRPARIQATARRPSPGRPAINDPGLLSPAETRPC